MGKPSKKQSSSVAPALLKHCRQGGATGADTRTSTHANGMQGGRSQSRPSLQGAHSSQTIRFLDASLLIEFMFMFFYINLVFKHFKNNKKYILWIKKCLKTRFSSFFLPWRVKCFAKKYLLIRLDSEWNPAWMHALELKMTGLFCQLCTQHVDNFLQKIVDSFRLHLHRSDGTYPQCSCFTGLWVIERWLKRFFQHSYPLYSLLFHMLIWKF